MRPLVASFDQFFKTPLIARQQIIEGKFLDVKLDLDGVTYPGINSEIPQWIKDYVGNRLAHILGEPVAVKTIFARLTTESTEAPHKVHSDTAMGEFSAHVYMSLDWPQGAGTGFYNHDTQGVMQTPHTDKDQINHKSMDQWKQTLFCQGDFNRILIHDSRYWHCAEGAFGSGEETGRLVLTTFFDVIKETQ